MFPGAQPKFVVKATPLKEYVPGCNRNDYQWQTLWLILMELQWQILKFYDNDPRMWKLTGKYHILLLLMIIAYFKRTLKYYLIDNINKLKASI